ncbi:MAG: PKD domain-containing protein [Acidimicrobiia bacterium]
MQWVYGTFGNRRSVAVVVFVAALIAAGLVLVAPGARATTQVHLTAAGDYGARATSNSVLQKIADLDPDAHLAVGDFEYQDASPESAWCNFVKAKVGEGFPFELVSGNHESLDEADGLINNFSACLPNQVAGAVGTYGREYYLDFPRVSPLVRVISVTPGLLFEDGVWAYAPGDAHYTWLSNAIDDARAKGAKWVIVDAHYPCLSVGIYNCVSGTGFFNLMMSKKVDLVIHGHEHAYMRTHQLRAGTTNCPTVTPGSYNPSCIADTDSDFTAGQGTVFATVGTGGTPLRDINPNDPEAPYFAAYEGLNSNPTYGLLDLNITDTAISAQFIGTSGGPFSDSFTITKGPPPVNVPPVAAFTTQMQDRTVTVNGSGSSDSDGQIVSYNWTFGDGSTATGATPPPHAYAVAGPYDVTLTVTDDQGATNSITRTVNATDPVGPVVLASDTFTRTLASGWGTADSGGAWTTSAASAFSANGTQGLVSTTASGGRSTYLRSVSNNATDTLVTLSSNKVVAGGGMYVSTVGRSIVGAGDYRSVVRFQSDGRVAVRLGRANAAGTETIIVPEAVIPGLTYAANDKLLMRTQVTGTSPTTIRVKVWKFGTTEPVAWNQTTTDSTANLQAAGSVGLVTYVSGSATNAPIVLTVDDLLVTKP